MAKTTAELIPEIIAILEKEEGGAMGIGVFLQKTRSVVLSPRLLMEALDQMAKEGKIAINGSQIELKLIPA